MLGLVQKHRKFLKTNRAPFTRMRTVRVRVHQAFSPTHAHAPCTRTRGLRNSTPKPKTRELCERCASIVPLAQNHYSCVRVHDAYASVSKYAIDVDAPCTRMRRVHCTNIRVRAPYARTRGCPSFNTSLFFPSFHFFLLLSSSLLPPFIQHSQTPLITIYFS